VDEASNTGIPFGFPASQHTLGGMAQRGCEDEVSAQFLEFTRTITERRLDACSAGRKFDRSAARVLALAKPHASDAGHVLSPSCGAGSPKRECDRRTGTAKRRAGPSP